MPPYLYQKNKLPVNHAAKMHWLVFESASLRHMFLSCPTIFHLNLSSDNQQAAVCHVMPCPQSVLFMYSDILGTVPIKSASLFLPVPQKRTHEDAVTISIFMGFSIYTLIAFIN